MMPEARWNGWRAWWKVDFASAVLEAKWSGFRLTEVDQGQQDHLSVYIRMSMARLHRGQKTSFIDDYTHFAVVYLMMRKCQFCKYFKEYEATTKFGYKITNKRCDLGREYLSSEHPSACLHNPVHQNLCGEKQYGMRFWSIRQFEVRLKHWEEIAPQLSDGTARKRMLLS